MRRKAEHLRCTSCGHTFTWNSWRKEYKDRYLLTGGNKAAFEDFASKWPGCKTPQQQMIQIDILLHAVHGSGALGPMLIDADRAAVMKLLDDLARRP